MQLIYFIMKVIFIPFGNWKINSLVFSKLDHIDTAQSRF